MIYRIDVRTVPDGNGADPVGESVREQIAEFGTEVGPIATSRIFLIDGDASPGELERAAGELLADPIIERAEVIDADSPVDGTASLIEIHLKPGVMDPVASSTEMAMRDMGVPVREVRTGRSYAIRGRVGREELQRIASRVLANGVIESVHFERFIPERFQTGHEYRFELRRVALRELSDEQLAKLSREGHLFLSQAEMKAIQSYYREQGREPTDIELETLAQTWSEHCVHKTLKSAVDVEQRDGAGRVVATRHYDNLIKETIFASTMELMKAASEPFCLSVFKDNAGVVAFDGTDAVCFKVETHNHPSAIEPYGGSATGIGGVIRDILGTGLAAKPVANTDVFCVAYPEFGKGGAGSGVVGRGGAGGSRSLPPASVPKGVIHPKRVLQQIVAGVRDYGNRMGIPTVNGAVYFDDRYLGNPLVFCGCVGLIPRDRIEKEACPGDAIVVMGGRTGRDGIHGATFSSAELTDTHADEFSHAVQIGNAITEKKVTDVILQARDQALFTAVTDCGAGGLSGAVGEMAEKIGATVELDKVPLKYAGLRYDEIWISEAQERMVLSVPADKLSDLLQLAGAGGRRGDGDRRLRDRTAGAGAQLSRDRGGPDLNPVPAPRHPHATPQGGHRRADAGFGKLTAGGFDKLTAGGSHRDAGGRRQCFGPGPTAYAAGPPEHRQQALGDPPIRPRGAGRVGRQAVDRSPAGWAERCGSRPAEAFQPARRRRRVRPGTAHRRSVRHGHRLDRRGGPQRGGGRRRSGPDCHPRQLLLAER